MNGFRQPVPSSSAAIRERETYIRENPPRLLPLSIEERSPRQQELLDEWSTVVVDGVSKPRSDRSALEILIRHAELYHAHLELAKKFLSGCTIGIRDRELAVLRIAWLSQAPFEWGAHVKIAKRNGVTPGEIERLVEGSNAVGWSGRDRAIVQAMEELHFDSMITDATWAALQEFCSDKQLFELVMLAGQYKTVAYYQNALRLPLPAENEGLLAR